MTSYRRALADRLNALTSDVDKISRSIERIEVATIVRDPSSALSVDAYDGLRRQVVAAAGERMAHLYQLARFADAVEFPRPVEELVPLVNEWMAQAGLERVADPSDERYYDVLGGEGPEVRILRSAYRDMATGRAVVMGQTERVAESRPAEHAADDQVGTVAR